MREKQQRGRAAVDNYNRTWKQREVNQSATENDFVDKERMTTFSILCQTVLKRFGDAAGLRPGGDTLLSAPASEQKNNGR